MTVSELIVFNSTIAAGGGTVLQHLQNIAVTREVYYGVEAIVTNGTQADVTSDIMSVNVTTDKIVANIEDDININITGEIMEVSV